jgi:hypothetical protein
MLRRVTLVRTDVSEIVLPPCSGGHSDSVSSLLRWPLRLCCFLVEVATQIVLPLCWGGHSDCVASLLRWSLRLCCLFVEVATQIVLPPCCGCRFLVQVVRPAVIWPSHLNWSSLIQPGGSCLWFYLCTSYNLMSACCALRSLTLNLSTYLLYWWSLNVFGPL